MQGRARMTMPALTLALAIVAAGCGEQADLARPSQARPRDPATLAPVPPTLMRPTATPAPTTTVALPTPVRIPDDPYAREPVVQVGTIEIPKLGLVHPLFQGVTLNNIDNGPSHWPGTALPGQPGNVVVAGHRATHSQPFRRLDELVPGDEVVFDIEGRRATYRVRLHMVVTPEDTWIARQTPAATATLYACHPVGSNAKRLVVRLALAA